MFAEYFWEPAAMSSEAQAHWVERVLGAFAARGLTTDVMIGQAGGPSTTTLTKYRNAVLHRAPLPEPRDDVFRKIDRAAGWKQGSARALWHGEHEPVTDPEAERPPSYRMNIPIYSWPSGAYDAEAPIEPRSSLSAAETHALVALARLVEELRNENAELRQQLVAYAEAADVALTDSDGSVHLIEVKHAARTTGQEPGTVAVREAQDQAGTESQDPGDDEPR